MKINTSLADSSTFQHTKVLTTCWKRCCQEHGLAAATWSQPLPCWHSGRDLGAVSENRGWRYLGSGLKDIRIPINSLYISVSALVQRIWLCCFLSLYFTVRNYVRQQRALELQVKKTEKGWSSVRWEKNQWPFILHLLFGEEGLMESWSCRVKCQLPLYDGICAAYLMSCFAWLKPSSTLYCPALLCIFILLATVFSRRDKIDFVFPLHSLTASSIPPLPSKFPEQSCPVCKVSRNFRIMIWRHFSDAFSHGIPAIVLKKETTTTKNNHTTNNPTTSPPPNKKPKESNSRPDFVYYFLIYLILYRWKRKEN